MEPEIRPLVGHREFQAAIAVRRTVFVDEQGGPLADEPDAWDTAARHWGVFSGGRLVGTARIYQYGPGVGKIGRVALQAECRGRGWGERLMESLVAAARALGFREVVLDAQAYACPFYERFGFRIVGEEFMDAGIPHRRMRLPLTD